MTALFVLVVTLNPAWAGRYCLYEIKKGDTLYSIAREAGVSLKELIRVNRIKKPHLIRVGQRIRVPCEALSTLSNYCSYRVKRGDSLVIVSRRFGVPLKRLAEINGLSVRSRLVVGQILMLPCDRYVRWKILKKVESEDRVAFLPERFRIGRSLFVSPVGSGARVRIVGKRIDIPVVRGERIRAAASGKVVYLKKGIHSMGTLVIVRHSGRYSTAYSGEGIRWIVKEGKRVRRGETIGYPLRNTVLRFEILKNNTIVLPGGLEEVR